MQHIILLVEDNPAVNRLNREALSKDGYRIVSAETISRARELLAVTTPDAIVLDVELPDGSGLDFCRELRGLTAAPVLFLSVSGQHEQIIEGLRVGGVDYLTKPYYAEELRARVAAQLRRTEELQKQLQREIRIEALALDMAAHRAFFAGQDLLLKPKEFLLLAALARNLEQYITTEKLYNEVWGMSVCRDTRTVLVHISTLRGKLLKNGAEQLKIERDLAKGFCLHYSMPG